MNTKHLLALSLSLTSSLTAFAGADLIQYKQSFGQGEYSTFNSTRTTKHAITINADGRTGKYCISGTGTCGSLYDIEFFKDADIQGKYNFNGSRGTFQWNFDGEKTFSGGFRFNQNMQPSGETGSIYTPYNGDWNGNFN